MAKEEQKVTQGINALGAKAAYNLANVTKTKPQYGAITPKWLTKFLEFKGLETGIYRVNKVVEGETPLDVLCSQTKKSDIIPDGFIQYEEEPREYRLNSISTIINVNTSIEDVYSAPYDQVKEQLSLAIESLRERQESQLINNDDYGLLKNVADSQRIQTRNGAQSVAHIPVNVSALDADWFVFSEHKIYAPMGIGAVYGKKKLLDAAKPYHGGGNMIKDVTFERTVYNPAPNKFEAGTGSIADAIGLGAALEYLNSIGMPEVSRYEHELVAYGMKELAKIPGLHLIGTAANKSSALSFVLDGVSNDAVGQKLDQHGIAVRVGHHCAQPIIRHYGLESVVRPTLALYNTFEGIDTLAKVLRSL